MTKKDKLYVTAWNRSKGRGFVTVSAFQNSKSTVGKNKKGEQGVMMMFEVFYHKTGFCSLNPDSIRVRDKFNLDFVSINFIYYM